MSESERPEETTEALPEVEPKEEQPAASPPRRTVIRRRRSLLREYFEALLIAVVFATFVRTYVVQAFKIPTGSMEDNLLIGDHILVNKFVYGARWLTWEDDVLPKRDVERGDVVVFKYPQDPGRDFIKRCVGLPGDRIEIVDKQLLVNGEPANDEPYVYFKDERTYPSSVFLGEDYRLRDNFGPYVVPDGQLFFMGDNRDNSHDSRFWGAVPAEYVKGRALLVYWSFDGGNEAAEWPGYVGRLKQLAGVAVNFATQTRWARSFRIVR